MTDCAHWLVPMLEAAERELAEEKRLRREDIRVAQNAIHEIRAIINNADGHFGKMPSTISLREQLMQEAYQMRFAQQAGPVHPCNRSPLERLFGGGLPF